MNKETFINYLNDNNINYNEDIINKLDIYLNFLMEYNTHTNLTALKTKEDIYLKHFIDSILFIKYIDIKDNQNILDIGTGAGFPGIILKIFKPSINLTVLDSNNKKTTFIKELTDKLNIDVEIINDRAENYIINKREYFDIVTSRAVSNLNTLSELSIPFVKINGYFLPMKGDVEEELSKSTNAIKVLGGNIEKIIDYKLPIEESKRSIVVIKKIKSSDSIYPRNYDKIIKKPL